MAIKGSITTADFINWDTLLIFIQKLEKDRKYKFSLLVITGMYTGLRISDILSLKWYNIITEKNIIELSETKTNKIRRITLHPNFIATVNRIYKKLNSPEKENLIFLNKGGKKTMSVQYFNREIKRLIKKYQLKDLYNLNISSHSLRKSLGRRIWSMNEYSDKSLILLSEIFNHSSISITKRYLGIKQEEIQDVYLSL